MAHCSIRYRPFGGNDVVMRPAAVAILLIGGTGSIAWAGEASPRKAREPCGASEAGAPLACEDSHREFACHGGSAGGMLDELEGEIRKALELRDLNTHFGHFRRCIERAFDSQSSGVADTERGNNSRLEWCDRIFRAPATSAGEIEMFSGSLHGYLCGDHQGLARVLATAAGSLDWPNRQRHEFRKVSRPVEVLAVIERCVLEAGDAFSEALSGLTVAELQSLRRDLYPVMIGRNVQGHTIEDRTVGRRLCGQIEQLDRTTLHRAAEALAVLADPTVLTQLKEIPQDGSLQIEGMTGTAVRRIDASCGDILIGSASANHYRLDDLDGVSVVIDLGGDDVYFEGTTSTERPVLVVIDLDGHDRYQGSKPGIQGAAILGVSMLLDVAGNDTYVAEDAAQGSALVGIGILIDCAGDDRYQGVRRVQGQAIGGIGILIDREGQDEYRGAMWAQGVGGPLGLGVLEDAGGDDHYYVGGYYYSAEVAGYEGWGQGVGAGLREVARGGVGVILDGGGDDLYEFDNVAHGGGYWGGLGIARDFGGNDRRLGATYLKFDGTRRDEARFQRYSNGFGCHFALGFLLDDDGDDMYDGTSNGLGFAWDCSAAYLCDLAGDDMYAAATESTQGRGAEFGFGVLFDRMGSDTYRGRSPGYALPNTTYRNLPDSVGSFSFLIDHAGRDQYDCGVLNGSYLQRGTVGGFLIDRARFAEAGYHGQELIGNAHATSGKAP